MCASQYVRAIASTKAPARQLITDMLVCAQKEECMSVLYNFATWIKQKVF